MKHRHKGLADAFKSAVRAFAVINAAWWCLYLPFSPYLQLLLSYGSYFALSILASFVWFWIALWRQNKVQIFEDE